MLSLEEIREYCLSLPSTSEDLPFDENTLAFRVVGKIFALCDIVDFNGINLKCDPERAVELREQYDGIKPGYHMNKTHWNTVSTAGDVPDPLMLELLKHSYDTVVKGLPKKVQAELGK
ncbi:MAG: MmcQ/YjbR family DNA-binding protein [Flavobacteriales bacterium]